MFKNRSIQMKVVKDKDICSAHEKVVYVMHPQKMRRVAITLGVLYTVKTVVDTSSKIALHIATK